jgi:tRNA U34 5-methylaminomethyl-2-thiouridine-forming methyltransferase MnmC
VHYSGLEAYPISIDMALELDYPAALGHGESQSLFEGLHQSPWERTALIDESFELRKVKGLFTDFNETANYDLIYFDAFGPRVQPELWTEAVFEKMYRALGRKGVLVTYSAKGSVRRALQAVGFEVERLPGPPGKREMLRGTKDLELL